MVYRMIISRYSRRGVCRHLPTAAISTKGDIPMKRILTILLGMALIVSMFCVWAGADEIPTAPDNAVVSEDGIKSWYEDGIKHVEYPPVFIYTTVDIPSYLRGTETCWTTSGEDQSTATIVTAAFSGKLPNGLEYQGTITGRHNDGIVEITDATCTFDDNCNKDLFCNMSRHEDTLTVSFADNGKTILARSFRLSAEGELNEI